MKRRFFLLMLTVFVLTFALGIVSVNADEEMGNGETNQQIELLDILSIGDGEDENLEWDFAEASTPKKYITVDGFFGELPNGDTEYLIEVENYGDVITLPENTFVSEGDDFIGWEYNYLVYQPGDEIVAEENGRVTALFFETGMKGYVALDSELQNWQMATYDAEVEAEDIQLSSPYEDFASYNQVDAWFLGWNTSPDGSGDFYEPNQNLKLNENEILILYAIWSTDLSKAYKVSFDPNFEAEPGWGNEVGYIYVKKGGTLVTDLSIGFDGYEFVGYYDKPEGGKLICYDYEEYTPTKDIVLYAHWNKLNAIKIDNPDNQLVYVDEWGKPGDWVYFVVYPTWDSFVESIVIKDAEGNNIELSENEGENELLFLMPESDVTIYISAEKDIPENSFDDVNEDDYYYNPVLWALKNGITTGTKEGKFSPKQTVTRAQMLTFLWRTAGSPEASIENCDFVDVAEDAYYYDAVLWAVEYGITKGTSATKFSPDSTLNRAQAVTLMARYDGIDEDCSYDCDFVDVKEGDYFKNAVAWASGNGITTGLNETHFGPKENCLRSQVVTFLFRAFAIQAEDFE